MKPKCIVPYKTNTNLTKMKKKVLFSIVAVALFAVAMAFNSQNNNTTRQLNVNALKYAKSNAYCLSCSYADDSWCYINQQTSKQRYCYMIADGTGVHRTR